LSMITTIELTKIYDNGVRALIDLTLEINSKRVAILGRNGAGKTTLLRILSTQLKPTKGRAYIFGYDVVKEKNRVRKLIASIPQEARPVMIASPYEHVFMYLTARGYSFHEASQLARKSLKEVGLWEFKDYPAEDLSGGMRRKVFLAMAIASNAELIFLDEPTTGLDPVSRLETWYLIKNLNSRIMLTTHYIDEAEALSEEVIILHKGRLVEKGSVSELLKKFDGKVRIEGFGDIRIGNIKISYVDKEEAKKYIELGATIKPITLEDILIMHGALEDEDRSSEEY